MNVAGAIAGQTVSIYGGTGLLGSALATHALACGAASVVCVGRAPRAGLPAGATFVPASVLDEQQVAAVPRTDLAIYVAGTSGNFLADVVGTTLLATVGFDRFVRHTQGARRLLVSSARVYGPRDRPTPLTEADPCVLRSPDPRNFYDAAKLVSESFAQRAGIVIGRLTNVFGAHPLGAPGTAFGSFVGQLRHGGPLVVTGPASSTRNLVATPDAADGLVRALLFGAPGEVYNIGSDDHLTTRELAEHIAAAAPVPASVSYAQPTAPGDHMVVSIAKAREQLGYAPSAVTPAAIATAVRHQLEMLRDD